MSPLPGAFCSVHAKCYTLLCKEEDFVVHAENIKGQREKNSCPGYLAPGICTTLC
jgi:hypothetical protein